MLNTHVHVVAGCEICLKMASLSRLEKFGTIFTRVRDLMRAGVMKEANKPLWFDVMAAYPPRDEPTYHREYKKDFLPENLYEEDAVRVQFYKLYGNQMLIDLTKHEDVKLSPCHRFITKYRELQTEGNLQQDEIFEATAAALAQEGLVLNQRRQRKKTVDVKPDSGSIKGLALLLQQAMETKSKPIEGVSTTTTDATASQEDKNDER